MANNSRITRVQWSLAAILLSPVHLLIGCEEPAPGYTEYTSDEVPALICPEGEAVRGVDCSGAWCDNISLLCEATGLLTGAQTWQPYFSEEAGTGRANESYCPSPDWWMSGIDCMGGWCDDLSMLCTQFVGSSTGACVWSGWYSEETGSFIAPEAHFITGIECRGNFCDEMRYQYCEMR